MESPRRLNHLVEVFQGNKPLVQGLVVLFLEHTPGLLDELVAIIRAGNLRDFHGVAFRLKSNLRVLGYPEIRDQVEAISGSFRQGVPYEKLEKELTELEDAVRDACLHLSHQ